MADEDEFAESSSSINGPGICFNNSEYKILAAVQTGSSVLSLLVTLLVGAIMVIFKKYKLYTQRLALYICISNALIMLTNSVLANVNFPVNDLYSYNSYCMWSGFFYQTTGWMILNATLIIMADMFMRVVYQKLTARYEPFYLFLIFVSPFLFSWIPFIENSYGQSGAWCWIRGVNNDANCTSHPLGIAFQFGLWYVPLYSIIIIGAIIYIKMVRHLYKNRYTGKYDHMGPTRREQLMKEVIPFLIFPWVFLVIVTLPAVYRVLDLIFTTDKIMTLSIISAAITPFSGTIAAILFGLDIETVSRLCHLSTYTMCCVKKKVMEYDAHPTMSDSYVEDDETKLETGYVIINVN